MSMTASCAEPEDRFRNRGGMESADSLARGGVVVTLAVVGAPAHDLPARQAVQVVPAAALRVA